MSFQRHRDRQREARGHGYPPSTSAAAPAARHVDPNVASDPPPPAGDSQPPADTQSASESVSGAAGTALVPARRRWLVRRIGRRIGRRPRRVPVDRATAVARRHDRRRRARRRATTGLRWIGTCLWWTARGAGLTLLSVWKAVWQPDDAAWIREIRESDPARARTERRKLRSERRTAFAAILLCTAGVWMSVDWWGGELVAWIPPWAYWVGGALLVLGLLFTGRTDGSGPVDERSDAQGMPDSLTLSASDRGVARTLQAGLDDTRIRGQVHDVRREPGGWGWTATLAVLDDITEARLGALERYLNTPRGGLVLSPVNTAARVRHLRIVMADLLATPIDAPIRAPGSIHTPAEVATRFDGGRLALELYARHVLILGRTGSGKSGVLHDIVDALTSMDDVIVDGLDLAAGPDLRAWEPVLRRYVGGPDYVEAEGTLLDIVELVKSRTARLGPRHWDTAVDGPAHALVIDEYGLVAEHDRLRVLVEYLITYGAKVGIFVVLCAQRKVREMMRSQLIASQVHIKIYLGMSGEDVQGIPKSERELGVRPHLFQQASGATPNDAGKAFVLGVEPMPLLVRFDRISRATAARRADERVGRRPELAEADVEALAAAAGEDDGVPELLVIVRDAIMATASAARRRPERASSEEIVTYLAQHGQLVDKTALIGKLRVVSGGLVDRSRDTNLAAGYNPKGLYLDDVDAAIAALRARDRGDGGD